MMMTFETLEEMAFYKYCGKRRNADNQQYFSFNPTVFSTLLNTFIQ